MNEEAPSGDVTARGNGGSPWLKVPDVSARLRKCDETVRRYVRDQVLPAYRIGGEFRFHLEDIVAWEAKQKVEPLVGIFDALSDATRVALKEALPRIRREAPEAIDALLATAEEGLEELAQAIVGGAISFWIPPFELAAGGRIGVEHLRARRCAETRDPRGGASDPWAFSHVIDAAIWRLIKPSLSSGVIWLSASKNRGYRFRSGDALYYCPYFGAGGGYAPCTRQVYEHLLEVSADFRQDIGNGTLVEVRPGGVA